MRYEARKFEATWSVWDSETRTNVVIDGQSAVGLSQETAADLALKLNEPPRFMVRKGIDGWMVWDRELRGPAKLSGRPYVNLTEEDAVIIRDVLIKASRES